ncbi:MAG TPA: hypothetical protein VF950_09580 [Planctomycetota bacterium]
MSAIIALILCQDPVDVLRTGSLEERDAAEAALKTLGTAAIAPLEAADGDPEFRIRARRILSALGATRALIDDLRSDRVPGNARRARRILEGRKEAVDLLRAATESDDDQQAIQAACVLLAQGEAPKAADLLERSVAAFARSETRDYEWVATEVMLRLAAAGTAEEVERAYTRALRGVPSHALAAGWEATPMGRALELARDRKLPLPAPLLRHFLANLRHDEIGANAWHTGYLVEKHRGVLRPALEAMVRDPDAQARRYALHFLLEWKVEPLPPGSVEALSESLVWWNSAIRERLRRYGEEALPALEAQLKRPDYAGRFAAADLLMELKPDAYRERVIELAAPHLEADGWRGNARMALRLLIRCEAAPVLRRAMASRDEQAAACGIIGLAALGEAAELSVEERRRLARFVARTWGHDEEDAAAASLAAAPELWKEVDARLRVSGEDGRARLELLAKWREARLKDPWPGR